jgi:catechol 2,3-dioxygenase-like lactoylglutathione lyase family enzyme
MSKFTKTHFVLAVPNLEQSAEYYKSVLGFEVREMAPGWLFFERDHCSIMAGECPEVMSPRNLGDHSYFAYIVVEGIDAYYESVLAAHPDLIKTLNDEAWGMREFGVRTIDGHRIMFGEAMKPSH